MEVTFICSAYISVITFDVNVRKWIQNAHKFYKQISLCRAGH